MIHMEKKQLNFSAPLLSARRYSSPVRSSGEELKRDSLPERRNSFPAKKSDANPEEVVKPGSVPFTWEQIPGRAKNGSHWQVYSREETANPPKLPPGRALNSLPPRVQGVRSGDLSFLRHGNKLSGELNLVRPQNKLSGELSVIRQPTKFFSGELVVLRAQNGLSSFPVNDIVKSLQLNKDVNRKADDSDSDTDDAAFSDALESHSMNCSTSGLSSSEVSITKPSEDSSMDVGNRDFMMNRFLPAAKAMTLESPQYASRRQIVDVEQSQPSKLMVPKIVKRPPSPHKNMAITLYKGQDIGSEHSEDDEEARSIEPRNIPVKSCGFFPWFCSKNVLHLLNPVPAMKVKAKSALASASKVGRLVKSASFKSPSQTSTMHLPSTNHKHKVNPMTKSCELNRIESKPKITPRPMFYSGELGIRNGDLQARNGLSPYRNYRRSSVSPCRNEVPYSPFHNGVGYLLVPKMADQPNDYRSKPNERASNLSRPMSFHQRKMQGPCPGNPVTGKPLYVDSVDITRTCQSSGRMDIMKARGIAKPSTCRNIDTNSPFFSEERLPVEGQIDHSLPKTNQSIRSSKILGNGHVNSSREVVLRTENAATASLLPPPLPKSPSESWLSRNLNAVSPRNSVSHSHVNTKLQPRQQAAQTSTTPSTKWETIVKSSHLRNAHGRYSEELVARVP